VGPVISPQAKQRIERLIESGVKQVGGCLLLWVFWLNGSLQTRLWLLAASLRYPCFGTALFVRRAPCKLDGRGINVSNLLATLVWLFFPPAGRALRAGRPWHPGARLPAWQLGGAHAAEGGPAAKGGLPGGGFGPGVGLPGGKMVWPAGERLDVFSLCLLGPPLPCQGLLQSIGVPLPCHQVSPISYRPCCVSRPGCPPPVPLVPPARWTRLTKPSRSSMPTSTATAQPSSQAAGRRRAASRAK